MVLNKNWFSILKATFGSRLSYQMLVVSFVFLRPLLFIPACSFSLLLPPNTEALCVTMLGRNTPLCPAQHSSHICVSSSPEKSDLIETGGSYGERSHAGWLRSSVFLSFCLEVSSHISVPFDYLENNMDNTVGK